MCVKVKTLNSGSPLMFSFFKKDLEVENLKAQASPVRPAYITHILVTPFSWFLTLLLLHGLCLLCHSPSFPLWLPFSFYLPFSVHKQQQGERPGVEILTIQTKCLVSTGRNGMSCRRGSVKTIISKKKKSHFLEQGGKEKEHNSILVLPVMCHQRWPNYFTKLPQTGEWSAHRTLNEVTPPTLLVGLALITLWMKHFQMNTVYFQWQSNLV